MKRQRSGKALWFFSGILGIKPAGRTSLRARMKLGDLRERVYHEVCKTITKMSQRKQVVFIIHQCSLNKPPASIIPLVEEIDPIVQVLEEIAAYSFSAKGSKGRRQTTSTLGNNSHFNSDQFLGPGFSLYHAVSGFRDRKPTVAQPAERLELVLFPKP